MSGPSPIDDGKTVVGDEVIAALAARMAKVVIDFESRATNVRAAFEHKIVTARAVRRRKLDELHAVLAKAKASRGGAFERIEFQRRRNIEVILLDGNPTAYVTVSDGLASYADDRAGLYTLHAGDPATLQGASEIAKQKNAGSDLNAVVDLIAAFIAMILADPSPHSRTDLSAACNRADEGML